jgi:hypothetical protein
LQEAAEQAAKQAKEELRLAQEKKAMQKPENPADILLSKDQARPAVSRWLSLALFL